MLDLLKELLKISNKRFYNTIIETDIGFLVDNKFLVLKKYLRTEVFARELIAEINSAK